MGFESDGRCTREPLERGGGGGGGGLQWRTNRHNALLNVSGDEDCPFCQVSETVDHLCIEMFGFNRKLECAVYRTL